MINWRHAVLVGFILILGLFLKLSHYREFPQRGATSDEYTYSFLGLSLLNTGIPESWSYFGGYANRNDLAIDGTHFPMVSPYFDHPPLFGIVVGLWAKIFGENSYQSIKLETIRLVPIFLSSVSSIFVYLLSQKVYGRGVATLALMIYSTVTLFVIHHRVVLSENFLTTVFLSILYIFECWKRRLTSLRLMMLGFFVGLALWIKESGIAVFGTILLLLLARKVNMGKIARFAATFFLVLGGYIVYGYVYDGALFWKILSLQSARDVGPQTLWYLISTPVIVNKVYRDGWYLFGLLSLFSLFRKQKYRAISIPFLSYFLTLLVTLTQGGQSGWYLIPLFPFIAIASSITIIESMKQRSWFFGVFLITVGMFLVHQFFVPLFGLVPTQFRLLTLFLFLPMIFLVFHQNRIFDKAAKIWLGFYLFGTTLVTLLYRHPV